MLIYGPKGFTLPGGTTVNNVTSPYTLSGLALNTEYDFYVVDSCTMASGASIIPVSFKTDSVGPVWASFVWSQTDTTLLNATVDFDATASTGDGLTYNWEYGNASTGTGVNSSATYTMNQTYTVKLTVTDRCGNSDDTTITVTVTDISIAENALNAGIEVYPNPSEGNFKVKVSGASTAYTIEVTDLSGKVIYKKANIATDTEQNINLGNVAQGVYFVRFSGGGLNASQRIIVN
jgi:PKD repeat protein